MDNKKVRLAIRSVMRSPDGEENVISGMHQAELKDEPHRVTLIYEEEQDGERARILLSASEHSAEMERRGLTGAKLIFLPGETTRSAYVTMYGEIPVELRTRSVSLTQGRDGGKLVIEYELYVSGDKTSDTCLSVKWRC